MGRYFEEATDGPLRDALAALARWPGVTQKKMMGCACFWVDDKMFAFVSKGRLVLTKLTPDERAGLGGEAFFTEAGRPPIRKWVQVRIGEPEEIADLEPAVRRSYERARDGLVA